MSDETEYRQRLSPKLRMIVNGDAEVNGYRAAMSASVTSRSPRSRNAHVELADAAVRAQPEEGIEAPPSRKDATDAALVTCFVHLNTPQSSPTDPTGGTKPSALKGNLATVDLTPAEVTRLSRGKGRAPSSKGSPTSRLAYPCPNPHRQG